MALDIARLQAIFVDETKDHLQVFNAGLLKLESEPDDPGTIDELFRAAHSIKGTARMMRLEAIAQVAHGLEETLDALRGQKIIHTKDLSNLCFRAVDCITDFVERLAAGEIVEEEPGELCDALERVSKGESVPTLDPELPAQASSAAPQADPAPQPKKRSAATIKVHTDKLDATIKLIGEMVTSHGHFKQRAQEIAAVRDLAARNLELITALFARLGSNVGRDARTIELAGQLSALANRIAYSSDEDASRHEALTEELQGKALGMRMLPLSTVFDRFPRAVRDLGIALDKEVDFVVTGGETELDRQIIEKLEDPLMHMVRNCVDHGLELPDEREKAGKPRRGTITLAAIYDEGNAMIVLRDDGAGISLQRVRDRALKMRVVDAEQLETMSESAIIDMIFLPGFSTSTFVTAVSGRGVGMDVVRQNIVDDLRGSIRIETEEGKGTTFYIRLPLTLSIVRVLLFAAGDLDFAVPLNCVREIIRLDPEDLISVVDKRGVRLRNEIIPVVGLAELLEVPTKAQPQTDLLTIIVQVGNDLLGLTVDALIAEENKVVKPLPALLRGVETMMGVIVSSSDRVVNVLHVPAIIRKAREAGTARPRAPDEQDVSEQERLWILVVDDSLSTRAIEKSILESYGYNVDVAGDGIEALEKVKLRTYDLIVTDIEMPRLDGFSLTEKLREDDTYSQTPIIIVTSRSSKEDRKRGMRVGANAYISKGSFNQSTLLETIESLVV